MKTNRFLLFLFGEERKKVFPVFFTFFLCIFIFSIGFSIGGYLQWKAVDEQLQHVINKRDARVQFYKNKKDAENTYIFNYRKQRPQSTLSNYMIIMQH